MYKRNCNDCNIIYIGQTKTYINDKMNKYLIKTNIQPDCLVSYFSFTLFRNLIYLNL